MSEGAVKSETNMLRTITPVDMAKVDVHLTIRKDLRELVERFELNMSELLEQAIIQRCRELLLLKYGLTLEKEIDI
ncbi:TPA_asm: hypothetical protein AvPV1_gp31, partial [Archaeoglobus veneficus pleomorphic virus 1]